MIYNWSYIFFCTAYGISCGDSATKTLFFKLEFFFLGKCIITCSVRQIYSRKNTLIIISV